MKFAHVRSTGPLSVRQLSTALAVMLLVNGSAVQAFQDEPESREKWFSDGRAYVEAAKTMKPVGTRAKNVILFVGDGMGPSTVTAARILEGQMLGKTGEEHQIFFEKFPYLAMAKVYNTNQQTPDSAGTMTAMMTGVKTKAGVVGIDQDSDRGGWETVSRDRLETLLELAEQEGKSTGVISTARITHATPAACYAKSADRDWEDDRALPAGAKAAGVKDIARQLIEFRHGNGIEVAMGGGRRHFLPAETADPEDAGATGSRTDGRNLMKEWSDRGGVWQTATNQAEFDAIDPMRTDHLLGLFERSHLEYEYDRPADTGGEPALSEMTRKGLEILQKNDRGFFLHVESGRIDHAHHASNAARALTDTIEFAKAVKLAYEMTDPNETLIIVTADHSHVFTIAGYPTRGNPILGLVRTNDSSGAPKDQVEGDSDGLSYTTLAYGNGSGYVGLRSQLSEDQVEDVEYLQESAVPLSSETHSAEEVAIYAIGPGAQWFHGTVEQNVVYHVMRAAFGF